jgi:hypothetical protein
VASPPICLCPKCQTAGRFLVFMSYLASVDYYRCDACVYAWFVPKGAVEPTEDVTLTKSVPARNANRIG